MILRYIYMTRNGLIFRIVLACSFVISVIIWILLDYTTKIQFVNNVEIVHELEIKQLETIPKKKLIATKKPLGHLGLPADLPDSLKEEGESSIKKFALNAVLSNEIPLNRTLSVYTHPLCSKKTYNLKSKATIVIIFHNEIFSVLIRTVWSILNITPPEYLDQIILVDDASTLDELQGKLEYYLKTRLSKYPVILERLPQRLGLIRARLHGARLVRPQANVIIFLDAHCECTQRWIEPLLERIELNRTFIAIPIIDLISESTFEYVVAKDYKFHVGGFTWDGTFDWIDVQKSELKKSPIEPVRTPTMAGGLFAIEKNYFWEIGSYDELMDGWGGENLEISFRVWQCGGRLDIIPCSRVGHVFRDFHPYEFPNNKDTHGINTARMAKVWMDDYQRLFFLHRKAFNNEAILGDITHRKMLRSKLHCKDFRWYLKNVYPEKFIPDENVAAYGRVLNRKTDLCLDDLQNSDQLIYSLGVFPCYFESAIATQYFSLTKTGEIRKEYSCATVVGRGNSSHGLVEMTKCHGRRGSQYWELTPFSQIRNPKSNLCLSVKGLLPRSQIFVTICDKKTKEQKLIFDYQKIE